MLFGQSVFQSVVERLEREAEEVDAEETLTPFTRRPLNPAAIFDTLSRDVEPINRPLESYLDLLETPAPPVAEEPEPMPDYLERTSLSDVSQELSIDERDTLDSLSEKRRAFARLNHPDTVSPAFRENANLRMTAANLLIDQAIKFLGS